jgi:23S rRNA (guanosine2251-2'-O)-methyltransferase
MTGGASRRPGAGARGPAWATAEFVYGVHAVEELIARRSSEVERVFVAAGRRGGSLIRRAREAGVPVSHVPREVLARKIGVRAAHQGVAAQVSSRRYADVDQVCRAAEARPDGVLVLIDRVVDPRNLGAMLRTCAAAGVPTVILATEGTVGLTGAVAKASAGAVESVAVAREARPGRRLDELRRRGFTVVGLDPRGPLSWDRADLRGRIIFVAGGEARGLSPAVARACDLRVAIPMAGGVDSLNVAVALGVLLFEAVRQRRSSRSGLETPELP